jgi:hypothetical protein
MDPKEVYDPLYKGVFTASERERLWRLRKDYEEHKKSELSASSNRLLFVRWLVKTGRLTDQLF